MRHAGAIGAVLLLLLIGAALLVIVPRQSTVASAQREAMTRFLEQDYTCCDLSAARQGSRCEEVLRVVGKLSHGSPGSELARAASNALARCPAAELIAMSGDPAVVRLPVPFLASKIQGADAAAARKAARLLASDSTLVREAARDIKAGKGALCLGPGRGSLPAAQAACPQAPALVAAVSAVLLDEREAEADRQKAAGLLTELGSLAAPAVPALSRALESRSTAARAGATAALGEIGTAAVAAVPALRRLAHREPVPGLRDRMLDAIARIEPRTGCCYWLFREPELACAVAFEDIGRRPGGTGTQATADCPAALVIEISRNQRAPVHAMTYLGQALRAPDIATRRQAATALGLLAGSLRWRGRIDREAIEFLRAAFRSGLDGLALDAAEALRQIGDSFEPEEPAAAPEPFLVALENPESDRRAAAAWALGCAGRRGAVAVPALRRALDGPDEVLADAAYAALNRIAVASGLERLGIKRDGKYELNPEVMAALVNLSRGEPGSAAR